MGRIAPAEIDQPRRARRGHPDGMYKREILSGQLVADNTIESRAETPGQLFGGGRQLLRPHVVRRRIDKVARQRGRLRHAGDVGGIDAIRRHQPDPGRIVLAVAAEAIAAERKGQRRQPQIMRRVGETVDAGRQQPGQGARPEQVARFAGRVLDTEQDLRDASVSRRECQARARLASKSIGQRELPGLRRQAGADRFPGRLGGKGDRGGGSGRRGLEYGMHAVLGFHRQGMHAGTVSSGLFAQTGAGCQTGAGAMAAAFTISCTGIWRPFGGFRL